MAQHKTLTGRENIHIINAFTYADKPARTTDTSLTSADIGKVARQLDNNSYWILISLGEGGVPTWSQIDASGMISPSAQNYFVAYDLTNQPLSGGSPANINFGYNVRNHGWSHVPGSSEFVCGETGLYFFSMDYQLNKTTGAQISVRFSMTVNGMPKRPTWVREYTTNNKIRKFHAPNALYVEAGDVVRFTSYADSAGVSIVLPPLIGNAVSAFVSAHRIK